MYYYNILFIITASSLLLKGKLGRYLAWGGLLLMFLLTYLRSDIVGADTGNYLMYASEHRIQEYICAFFVYLIANGVLSERGLIQILAIITYLCVALIIYRYKVNQRLFIFFFLTSNLFAAGLNVSRQVASVAVFALFLPFIYEKKTLKSILFFIGPLLAGGLHYSSFLLSFLYLFRYLKCSDKSLMTVIIILTPLLLFDIIPIEQILQSIVPKEYMDEYSQRLSRNEQLSILGYGYRIISMLFQLYIIKYIKDYNLKILFVFSILIFSASMGLDTVVARVFMINSLIFAIVYANVFQSLDYKNSLNRIIYYFFVVFGLYFAYYGLESNSTLNHYTFYFQ